MDLELNDNLGTLIITAISGRNPQMNGLGSLRMAEWQLGSGTGCTEHEVWEWVKRKYSAKILLLLQGWEVWNVCIEQLLLITAYSLPTLPWEHLWWFSQAPMAITQLAAVTQPWSLVHFPHWLHDPLLSCFSSLHLPESWATMWEMGVSSHGKNYI